MNLRLVAASLVLAALQAHAHRVDEYLQGTLISVEQSRIRALMTLTPGIAVVPLVLAAIDTDSDGAITKAEEQAYAAVVLRDLSLKIDGERITPRLLASKFPSIDEMKDGRGEIRLDLSADLPPGGRNRKLTLTNRHQTRISAWQVNCLASRDSGIQIAAQNRNYTQSEYELAWVHTASGSSASLFSWFCSARAWLAAVALLLVARLIQVWWLPRSRAENQSGTGIAPPTP